MQKQVWKFCACFFMRKIGLSLASGIGVITGKAGKDIIVLTFDILNTKQ